MKEQQIQRYEAEEYASANLHRLAEVANALGLNINEIAEFRATSQEPLDIENDTSAWDPFPIKEMYRRNWIEEFSGSLDEAISNAEELVREFAKGSLDKPVRAAARQRVRLGGSVNWYALLAWQCRIIALAKKKKITNKYNQRTINDKWFTGLAHLSCKEDGTKTAIEYLRNSGIRVVVESHLPLVWRKREVRSSQLRNTIRSLCN